MARALDQQFLQSTDGDAQVEAAIANYETAFRMQAAVPELCDICGPTPPSGTTVGNPQILTSQQLFRTLLAKWLHKFQVGTD